MNSTQKGRCNYYTKNKDKLIKLSLDYYYQHKDDILLKNRLHAKNYYAVSYTHLTLPTKA